MSTGRVLLANPDPDDVVAWVQSNLGHLCCDVPARSTRFRGTQSAADETLQKFQVRGYAKRRNDVWPYSRRGASGLSPWIRHGMLSLPRVWDAVEGGPNVDVAKFRDELLWAEYARHLYARIGYRLGNDLRASRREVTTGVDPWDQSLACVRLAVDELERDGWLVNQSRMWLASHWAVRSDAAWRDGEDRFFVHLLDGSRSANRLGWQWTVGTGNGRSYGFSRWQVEKRAPGLCDSCTHRTCCPIQEFPNDRSLVAIPPPKGLGRDDSYLVTGGPKSTLRCGPTPEIVWFTAESLGNSDPALVANPDLPVLFVFDEPLLARLQLSGKRLVFLAERLAELALTRTVELHRGRPAEVLLDRRYATTFTPVPGWRRITAEIEPTEIHPWPWLRYPTAGSVASFSAWRDPRRPTAQR